MGGNNESFENFERNKYLKKLPSMQRVKKDLAHRSSTTTPGLPTIYTNNFCWQGVPYGDL